MNYPQEYVELLWRMAEPLVKSDGLAPKVECYCTYCEAERWGLPDDEPHADDCPIILIRAWHGEEESWFARQDSESS